MLRSMEWQRYMALGIVAMTAVLFAWSRFGSRRSRGWRSAFSSSKGTSGGGCGCGGSGGATPLPSVIYRARKGGPVQVEVRRSSGGSGAGG